MPHKNEKLLFFFATICMNPDEMGMGITWNKISAHLLTIPSLSVQTISVSNGAAYITSIENITITRCGMWIATTITNQNFALTYA